MNEDLHIDSEKLARCLAGEADAALRADVERWAAAAPENRRELEAMRSAWELGATGTSPADVDVDQAWSKVRQRITAGNGSVIPIGARNVRRWLAVAAVLTGLVFAVRWFFTPRTQQVLAADAHVTATLADSSTVVLAPGSEVNVHMGRERRITLRGEAYFEVTGDEQRPFIVATRDVSVTVLGTGFEITAYDTSGITLVRVRHGKVSVATPVDTVVLVAGEHARYDRRTHLLERTAAPPMEVWGERIIQFERAPLAEVADELGRLFNVRIELANDALAPCRLTASFDNETIGSVLDVISATFGLTVEQPETGRYVLDGDGC